MGIRLAKQLSAIYAFILVGAIGSSVFAADETVAPAAAADQPTAVKTIKFSNQDSEYLRKSGLAGKFLRMLESPAALARENLNEIDFSVRDIAFYRMSDRQNKRFSRNFYETLEQKMVNKFNGITRFAIHECFECKVTRVVVQKNQFQVLRQWDSNQTLNDVGKKLGVDHFALWDAYEEHGQAVINLRIVSAQNGQVRWSHQFRSGEIEREMNWEVYTSFWRIKATRQPTSAAAPVTVDQFMSIGIRSIDRSTISERLFFSYGMETFFNTADRDAVNMFGLTLHARMSLEIDTLIGFSQKDYGNWMFYGDVDQTFVKTVPTYGVRGGLEIRPNKRYFIDIGGMYFLTKTFDVTKLTGYESTASFGGIGYDITLGYRY